MQKHVVVLGGGFAGIQAAIELQKRKRFHVTLVSDRDYFFLYPTSIWIPTRGIPFEKAKVDLADIQRAFGFSVVVDRVREIRSSQNIVQTDHREISYDYLIVAVGAEKVMHEGHEHTLSICGKPEMSLEIRDRLDELIERGGGRIAVGFGGNPKDRSAVRGGPAFEFLFNVLHYVKQKGLRDRFEFTFFAPMESPGERMGKRAVQIVDRMFRSMKIGKRYGKKIKSFRPGAVVFEDESVLEADLIMFIPGNAGHSLMKQSDLPLSDAGFVKIDDSGLVAGTSNVFAVGDVAALEGPDWKAKQGHLAEIMARNAVQNIIWMEEGVPQREGYQKHLSIICVMDTGSGAAFVYRDGKHQIVIPMPIIGHWLKRAWGLYARLTKVGKMVRLPGM